MSQRGSLTVEAALVIPVIAIVALAALELFGSAVAHQAVLAAAREGARVAATVVDPVRAVSAVRDALPPTMASTARITVHRPATVGRPAEVVVVARHDLITPLLDGISFDLTARAVMRVER